MIDDRVRFGMADAACAYVVEQLTSKRLEADCASSAVNLSQSELDKKPNDACAVPPVVHTPDQAMPGNEWSHGGADELYSRPDFAETPEHTH